MSTAPISTLLSTGRTVPNLPTWRFIQTMSVVMAPNSRQNETLLCSSRPHSRYWHTRRMSRYIHVLRRDQHCRAPCLRLFLSGCFLLHFIPDHPFRLFVYGGKLWLEWGNGNWNWNSRGMANTQRFPDYSRMPFPEWQRQWPSLMQKFPQSFASAIFARPYYDCNTFNNIWTMCFKHNMAGSKSPKRAGRNLGVQVWIFEGQFVLRGIFRCLAPQALAKSPRRRGCRLSKKKQDWAIRPGVGWHNLAQAFGPSGPGRVFWVRYQKILFFFAILLVYNRFIKCV